MTQTEPAVTRGADHPPASGQSPVRPSVDTAERPLGLDAVRVTGGFWAPRQRANGVTAIPSGREQLERAANLPNLRIVAGLEEGEVTGPIFADSDVYKWLEAVAWEYARSQDPALITLQREVTGMVAAAQCDDGYLDSVVTARQGSEGRYTDLAWSHEHYCAGHLIQAAVAQVRCTGDRDLLAVANRVADHLVATFGPDGRGEVDGHPVIEMALVELYRETGTQSYLDLADWFVHRRGTGQTAPGGSAAYFSDRVAVSEQTTVEGHAVRAVYLAAGATDLAVERGDDRLLAQLQRQFAAMWATKTYLTGGLGARWDGEAFGDPFELPSDRAYAETCAAIGGIQWAWRLLLATGDAGYADAIERMLCNGFLSGVSLSGTEYFYVNPLQLRGDALPDGDRSPAHGRRGWFACACCPPNIMRTLASLDAMIATASADDGMTVHQYAPAAIRSGNRAVSLATDYPWDGTVDVTIERTGGDSWPLRLRVPAWARGARLTVGGDTREVDSGAYAEVSRAWAAGDRVRLELPMTARVIEADPRVDAVRGCVAVERGPLVYAFEQADQAAGVSIDDLELAPDSELRPRRTDELGGVVLLEGQGGVRPRAQRSWPYRAAGVAEARPASTSVPVTAIPYYAWANREVGAMRVWVPRRD